MTLDELAERLRVERHTGKVTLHLTQGIPVAVEFHQSTIVRLERPPKSASVSQPRGMVWAWRSGS